LSEIKYNEIGLKVGLEIHQQLSTNKKLFCNCTPSETDEFEIKFSRKLRLTKSELGEYDPAALFESAKSKTMVYYSNATSSCLVEFDEEPPHELDDDAKNIALLISSSLKSNIFNEFHVMRKIVIDGSNTSGFQRTMLVSQGGQLEVDGKQIGVQAICLEEDAAKLLGEKKMMKEFSLERLGIPLIEIALEPVSASPLEIRKIALTIGRLLRASKKVTRGLGSIRQDVNVSITGGKVVEVKGVQQLDQLEKVIEYESKRQHGLLLISEKMKEANLKKISKKTDVFEISKIMADCKSKIIQNAVKSNAVIKVIKIKNFQGIFSYEPYHGIRLGKELGQLVRFFGIGGIFHSDELPNYGIEQVDIEKVKKKIKHNTHDGFLIIAGEKSTIDYAIDSIINRIEDAKKEIPAETRGATSTGETVFLRPKPGASRMYPETDIPPVIITKDEIKSAIENVPKSWKQSLLELEEKYNLNTQLAEQLLDSDYLELFEKICQNKKNQTNFVASTLCSTITNLQRQGMDSSRLTHKNILQSFEFLSEDKISKESMEIIFQDIMSGKSKTVEDAIKNSSIGSLNEEELSTILDEIIKENSDRIRNEGVRIISSLMGLAMKKLRGKVSGEKVNRILQNKIQKLLKK